MKVTYADLLKIYLLQLKGRFSEAEENLIRYKPDIDKDLFTNIATWFWLMQREVYLSKNSQIAANIDDQKYISYICNQWELNHSRIWQDGKEDIYLSNLAIAYAALKETKNTKKYNFVQKTMTEIRDYVFENLLIGGSVISGKVERRYSADQLMSVIPFGLFSPEDLIIVEAVQKMIFQLESETGILPYLGAQSGSAAATAMLALYYLEKSDREKAIHYAKLVRENVKRDSLANVLLDIFDFFSLGYLEESEKIIHVPLGNENVYNKQITERIPHYPSINDYLYLPCQVISKLPIADVFVEIEDERTSWKIKRSLVPKQKNSELIYVTEIPPLPHHGIYYYYFTAELQNGKRITSKRFELTTLEVQRAESFRLVHKSEQQLLLAFGNRNEYHGLLLQFNHQSLEIRLIKNVQLKIDENFEENSVSIYSGKYTVTVYLKNAKIEISEGIRKILTSHPLFSPIQWSLDVENQIREFKIHWYSPETEKFFGFGERYNHIEQRGNEIDCFVYNQYRDQGTKTYLPIPFYLTNNGYGCFIKTNTYTKFDLAKELADKCTISIEQVPNIAETSIHYYFGNYKEQLKAFINQTGKPKLIPAWALGPWMSSNNWDRESIVRNEIETTKRLKIPATVIVLEQWSDETTYYMFNDAEYELKHPAETHSYEEIIFPEWGRWPNPKGMIEYIHNNDLKILLWQIPIQKYLNKQSHPLKDQDEAYMIEKGYVVKNSDGTPYRIPENWFTGSLLMDFTNEEGKKWWFAKRQYLLDIGVDGFKTDGGEFVFGKNLKFANGQTGIEMRNQYPNDYIAAYFEFAQQNNGITFSRAGYTGAQNFPAHWAGDERSTFEAFKRSLIAGISSGLSGIVFWGWDLAGFNGDIPSAELYMRSAAMAAFCPIMQYHAESKGEFNQDRTPWNIAERTGNNNVINVYRFFANVRMNLLPYIYQEAVKSSKTGLPLMRALMIEYPEDQRVQTMYDEYLFGDSLLVAPIIEEGSFSRMVYLPQGTWFNMWTNEKVKGPAFIKVSAQYNEIPVFVKANRALLLNLNNSKQLGSYVGNTVTQYVKPLCIIYYDEDFKQTLTDHLGNKVELQIFEYNEELVIEFNSTLDNIEFEVKGTNKNVRIMDRP